MIHFIVVSSFFLQDYISFISLLVFFFLVFSFGVVVFLSKREKTRRKTMEQRNDRFSSFIFFTNDYVFMNLYFYLRNLIIMSYKVYISKGNSHRLLFWKSIHLEVASDSFCFLINSSWLLVFGIILISFLFTGFNLYCWTGIHFS